MRRLIMTMALVCSTANAIDLPVGSERDGRIQRVNYRADDVVKVGLAAGLVTRIILNPDETVTGVYTGYSDGYDITSTANAVTIQPQSVQVGSVWVTPDDQWATNLAVETTKRHYSFDLEISSQPAYRVQYFYPSEVEAERVATVKAEAIAAIKAQPKPIKVKNLNYYMRTGKRSESITPLTVFDNEHHTFISFAKHAELPSVYLGDSETIADSDVEAVRPDTIRVKSIARTITLRKGRQVVTITNRSFPRGAE